MVVDLFVFIHPDLSGSHAVCQSFAPRVRGSIREHMTHMGAWVYLQAAPTLPNLRDINNNITTRIWLASQHKALPCGGRAWKQKSCFVFKGNIFGSIPLGNCSYLRKGMFKFFTAIKVVGSLACFPWLCSYESSRRDFTGNKESLHDGVLGKCKPDLTRLFSDVCCDTKSCVYFTSYSYKLCLFCMKLGPYTCRKLSYGNTQKRHITSYPEGEFQVLSSPHLHPCVIRPQVMEVVLFHSKQTTCHRRRPEEKKKTFQAPCTL